MQYQNKEEANKLAKEDTNGVPSDQTVDIPFFVDKEVIRSHLWQKHLNRWETCSGASVQDPMIEPLPRKRKELHAMSRQKLKSGSGLLIGHTTIRSRMFKLRLTWRQECRLCRDKKEDSLHILYVIVQHWHAKETEPWVVCS
jgi:hypothetical protein